MRTTRTVGEIFDVHARIGWQGLTQREHLTSGEYYLVTGTDFLDGVVDFAHCRYVSKERYDQDVHIQLKEGDLLITKDGTIGKVAVVRGLDKPATLNGGVFLLRDVKNVLDPLYAFFYFNSPYFLKLAGETHTGSTIHHLNQKNLCSLRIPIPGKLQQKKIATSVHDAMKRLSAMEALFKKLYETAHTFGKSALEESFKSLSCEKMRLGDLCEIERGRSKHRPRNDPRLYGGKYPFIQTGDIRNAKGGVILQAEQYYSDFGLKQSRLWAKGTLCVTIAANIGETAFLGIDACFPDSVVGIVCKDRRLNADYLNAFMVYFRPELESLAPGTAQKNLNVRLLSDIEIPLPAKSVQSKIVDEVNAARQRGDRFLRLAERGLANCARMRKAILAEAFK